MEIQNLFFVFILALTGVPVVFPKWLEDRMIFVVWALMLITTILVWVKILEFLDIRDYILMKLQKWSH